MSEKLLSRLPITLDPINKLVIFQKVVSFKEIKEELDLLKKSYKDIYDWSIIINNTYYSSISQGNFVSNTLISNCTCGKVTGFCNCTYPGSVLSRLSSTNNT